MAYVAWSVVFGEQPTAAKWNQLGANDAGFKDGTNIDDDAIKARHIEDGGASAGILGRNLGAPVGFSAYRNTNQSGFADSTYTKANFDTEVYDYGSNFDTSTYRFTAPYAGIYHFDAAGYNTGTPANNSAIALYVNGSMRKQCGNGSSGGDFEANRNMQISADIALNASQYVEVYFMWNTSGSPGGSNSLAGGSTENFFMGRLVGRTD